MSWLICGTVPDDDFPLCLGSWKVNGDRLEPEDVRVLGKEAAVPSVPVQRGTPALAAAALLVTEKLGAPRPQILLAGDCGSSKGSSALYAWLASWLGEEEANLSGLTFHYLFPSVDGHNRILMALEARRGPMPALVADAGFMYAAKMSGYADAYDLFTPDVGELAFLADEKAPHPFYTRGFLLAEDHNIPPLLERVLAHGNCPRHLLIKGAADHIVCEGELRAVIDSPSVPAMECIGGTGDIVTGLVTAFAAAGWPLCAACRAASRSARRLAALCEPQPDTPVADLIRRLPDALSPDWLRELEDSRG